MKIIIQTNKIKCDIGKCKNIAKYSVAPDGAPLSLPPQAARLSARSAESASAKFFFNFLPLSKVDIFYYDRRGTA